MECLSKVPTSNLSPGEIKELVDFVHEKNDTYQVYVGRNEELMMHAFNAFARLARVPDRDVDPNHHEPHRRSAGTTFRRDHADLVQIALRLLVQNSRREIPMSESAEREQKSKLSQALTSFLQSCSGPAEGGEGTNPPPVWPQAVSILQMRDATEAMVQVMKNEEDYGDAFVELNLERSALADTIEPLLYTLPMIALKSEIKARLLNRLAELLEGDASHEGGGLMSGADMGGDEDGSESKSARKRRVQQHVAFYIRNGLDLVLTQLENEMSELRQMQIISQADLADDSDAAVDVNNLDDVLPHEAQPEVVAEKVGKVLRFVEAEEARAEAALVVVDGDEEEDSAEMDSAVKQFVDWRKFGIAALYSQELHMMADVGDGPRSKSVDSPLVHHMTAMSAARKTDKELAEEEANARVWGHAEKAAAATLRILTACVKYGSTETVAAFLDRMAQPTTQNDVLMIAGYAGVFTRRAQSDASLKFVGLWNEVLRALSSRSLVGTNMLPLLDTLARLLPKLLMPYAERIGKALDTWKARCVADGAEAANEELLRGQQVEESRMLTSLVQVRHLPIIPSATFRGLRPAFPRPSLTLSRVCARFPRAARGAVLDDALSPPVDALLQAGHRRRGRKGARDAPPPPTRGRAGQLGGVGRQGRARPERPRRIPLRPLLRLGAAHGRGVGGERDRLHLQRLPRAAGGGGCNQGGARLVLRPRRGAPL